MIECRLALRPTQTPIKWGPRAVPLGLKRQGRDADCSPPISAEVTNDGAKPPLHHMPSWHNA
jgi:hypothetical protein